MLFNEKHYINSEVSHKEKDLENGRRLFILKGKLFYLMTVNL